MATRTTTLSRIDSRIPLLTVLYFMVIYTTMTALLASVGFIEGDSFALGEAATILAVLSPGLFVLAVAVTVTHWYFETHLAFFSEGERDE